MSKIIFNNEKIISAYFVARNTKDKKFLKLLINDKEFKLRFIKTFLDNLKENDTIRIYGMSLSKDKNEIFIDFI